MCPRIRNAHAVGNVALMWASMLSIPQYAAVALKILQNQARPAILPKRYFMKLSLLHYRKALPWFLLSIVVVVLDQWTKYLVLQHLYLEKVVQIFPFFNLILSYNTGAAFGLLGRAGGWQIIFLSLISIFVIILAVIWLLRLSYPNSWTACALSLLLGGALGNLIDRIRINTVIDFLDFHWRNWHYATFNLADSAIVAGVCMLMLQAFFKKKPLSSQ